jgi:glycosyltransferase involved in cell wall biosynthesis
MGLTHDTFCYALVRTDQSISLYRGNACGQPAHALKIVLKQGLDLFRVYVMASSYPTRSGYTHMPYDYKSHRPRVLLLGTVRPPSSGIATMINDMLSSSLAQQADLILFDSSKRTARDRSFLQGLMSQIRVFLEYIRIIVRTRPDVVHIHSGGSPDIFRKAFDVFAARMLGRKVVLHNHGGDFKLLVESLGPLRRAFVRFTLERCNRVIVLSQWWLGFYSKLIDSSTIRVLHNAIKGDPYQHLPSREEARRLLGLPSDRCVFMMIGVMGRNKGTYDIVEAAPAIIKAASQTLLLMVGPDENTASGATAELERLCVEHKVEGVVEFRGEVDARQKLLYYAASDCLLLPSHVENAPMTIIEAMAAGLPVVSTRIAAIPEMVDHDETGILIEPGRPDQIAEAVVRLVNDRDISRKMGHAGRERFLAMFDMERVFVPEIMAIYQDVMM